MGFVIPTAESDVRIPYGPFPGFGRNENGLDKRFMRARSAGNEHSVLPPVLPPGLSTDVGALDAA